MGQGARLGSNRGHGARRGGDVGDFLRPTMVRPLTPNFPHGAVATPGKTFRKGSCDRGGSSVSIFLLQTPLGLMVTVALIPFHFPKFCAAAVRTEEQYK
jgi:hypothetical protein